MNACCIGCSVPSAAAIPSMVRTSWPSACTASTVQLFTASPSRWIEQAPHDDVSQPMFVPVSPTCSRMYCTSKVRGSTSCVCSVPLTVTVISTDAPNARGVWNTHHAPNATPPWNGAPRTPRRSDNGVRPRCRFWAAGAQSEQVVEVDDGQVGEEADDRHAEDRVVPTLGVVGLPEAADAVHDRHHRQHADHHSDDRADASGDAHGRQHEREHDVHQQATARADEERLLERRAGFGGGGGAAFGKAQQLAHEPVGCRRRRRRGDGGCGGAHGRPERYVAATAPTTSAGLSTTTAAPAPWSSSWEPKPHDTPMQSIPLCRAPSTSWSRSPTITTPRRSSPSARPGPLAMRESSPSAWVITSALVRRPEPMSTVAPACSTKWAVNPKCSTMRIAVGSGFAVAMASV